MFQTPPDIAGDNFVHNLGTLAVANGYVGTNVKAVQLIVTGSGTCRMGDEKTSSGRGLPIAAGAGMFFPYLGEGCFYALGGINIYVPTGATASVAWED